MECKTLDTPNNLNQPQGDDTDVTDTGSTQNIFGLLTTYTNDAIKRFLAVDGAEQGKYSSKITASDYTDDKSALKFEYNKSDKSISIFDVAKTSANTVVKILEIAANGIKDFLNVISNPSSAGDDSKQINVSKIADLSGLKNNKVNGIEVDSPENGKAKGKCITIYILQR